MAEPDPFPLPRPATAGEARVLAASRAGTVAELAGLPPAARVVRAGLLLALLQGDNEDARRTPAGVRVHHAVIAGPLLLDGLGSAEAPLPPLALPYATPAAGAGIPALARQAHLAALDLSYATVARFEANGLHCPDLVLTGLRVATVDGAVRLDGAQLGAGSWLNGIGPARAEWPGPALVLADATLTGAARLQSVVLRQLVLSGASIAGQALLGGSRLAAPAGEQALMADGARIGGVLELGGCSISGSVRLLGAQLGGLGIGPRARLSAPGGVALIMDNARLAGPVHLREACLLEGELRALGAQVSGDVVLAPGTRITRPGGDALALGGAELGSLVLKGVRLEGCLRLPDAALSGDLMLAEGCSLSAPEGAALEAPRAMLGGSLVLAGARILGMVNIAGARLGGALRAEGLALHTAAPLLLALDGTGLEVAREARFSEPAAAVTGRITLDGAHIGGALALGDARLALAPGAGHAASLGDPDVLLSLRGARVGGALVARLPAGTAGTLDLREAALATLDDAGGTGWGQARPRQLMLRLDGLRYGRLAEPGGRPERLGFLLRQYPRGRPREGVFHDQPFSQLARTLRAQGLPEDADWFARRRRVLRRRSGADTGLRAVAGWLSGTLFGHGYATGRSFASLGACLALGALLLLAANGQGSLHHRHAACWPTAGSMVPHDLPQAGAEAVRMAADLALPGLPLRWAERCTIAAGPWHGALQAWRVLALAMLAFGAASLTGLLRRD